jgi:rubredoxin
MATAAAKGKKRTAGTVKVRTPVKRTALKHVPAPKKKNPQRGKVATADIRYRCRLCGYIYSPLRGEPHNGIPPGTAFEDLPDTYVCPVCGFQGKGKIGKWGFDEWRPTRYICSVCGYVYDEARGEPHRGIRPGTRFDDLPDTYVCPVCALDIKLTKSYGKVLKQGFDPLNL